MAIKFIIPAISESITKLVNSWPGYYDEAINQIKSIPDNDLFSKEDLENEIKKLSSINLKEYLSFDSIKEYVKGVISIASGIFDFFVAIIVSIYILLERDSILQFGKKALRALVKEDEKYNLICKYFNTAGDVF